MMWSAVFLLVISIAGINCDDLECFFTKKRKCSEASESVPRFPKTADDLLAICQNQQVLLTCFIEVHEECKSNSTLEKRELDYLKQVCDHDDPSFKVISNNLQCLESVRDYLDVVPLPYLAQYSEEAKNMDEHMNQLWNEDSNAAMCLEALMDVIGPATAAGVSCNNSEVTEIVQRYREAIGNQDVYCTAEIRERMKSLLEDYEIIITEEVYQKEERIHCDDLECFFRKKRKCYEELESVPGFPKTDEELLAICQNQQALLTCLIEVREECKSNSTVEETKLDYLKQVCDHDDQSFKVISSNLQCLESVRDYLEFVPTSYLVDYSEEAKHLDEQIKQLWNEDSNAAVCLRSLMDVHGPATAAGVSCNNSEVKEIVQRCREIVGNQDFSCPTEVREKVKSLLEDYETVITEKVNQENKT